MTSLSADDSLLNHYGFSHDPFTPRVPGFKFFPAQRKPVLGQLHHLARYSQLLLVVTGPEGSGKTLVRQALVASSNKQSVQSVMITPQATMDSNLVLQQVAQALGCPRTDFDSIMAQIIQLALTGQEIYLLVDDAEQLTGAAVETLLRLAAGGPEGRPHVFLFGEESLLARLEALVDGEERFHAIALQPYEEDETREYLVLRLEGAGVGLECFNEEQILRIHEQSGGWPGAINQVAREELIEAMHHSRAKKKSKGWAFPLPMKHVLALLAVLLVVLIALFVMRDGSQEPSATPVTTSLPLGNAGAGSQEAEREDAAESLPAAPQPPIVREPLAAAAGEDVDDFPRLGVPATPPVSATEQPRRVITEQPAADTAPVAPPTTVTQPAPAPAPSQPAPERPAPAVTSTVAATSWHGSQPAGNYLVQILGTRNESNAQALVRQHGSDYRYFTKMHEGRPLYVVTYGNFSSRNAAVQAITALPAALQAGKPWVRNFSSVQQEIAQKR